MLPMPLRERLAVRFAELLTEAEEIRRTITVRTGQTVSVQTWMGYPVGENKRPNYEVFDREACLTWMTKCTTLLSQAIPRNNPNRNRLTRAFKDAQNANPGTFRVLAASLKGIKDDFDGGFLDDLAASIEASIAGDYMGQAEQLLIEGQSGHYDHVPAAVLAGAVLEKSLRSLCNQQTPPVPVVFSDQRPKMLNALIDDLKKAGVYNETRAKHLRAWAGIRNHAAHGEFDQFDRRQVQSMVSGVRDFLADYLSFPQDAAADARQSIAAQSGLDS